MNPAIPKTEPGPVARPRSPATPIAWAVAIASTGVLMAGPWLDDRLVPAGWLGVAAGLVLATGRRGWRGEAAVLAGATIVMTLAFHWTPAVLSAAMRASTPVGYAVAGPLILWDACRMALPFWVVGRLVSDPRAAWLPAGLTAVVAEALIPSVFPWRFGYTQLAWPATAQAACLLGAGAGTLAVFAAAGTLVAIAGLAARPMSWRMPAAAVAAIGVTAANLAFGVVELGRIDARMAAADTLRLALVQADHERDDGIDRLRRLTREACRRPDPPDLVCWPECSGGSYEEGLDSFADEEAIFSRSRDPRRGLRPLPDPDRPLLLGGRIYRGFRERPDRIYQAALLLDEDERLVGSYHKRHLMPFGEYVPFADVITELRLTFPMETEYDQGSAAVPLACGRVRLGTLLCYEDMVPSAAASLVARAADVLVSLVHAAAFANRTTLRQHRLLAQQRAIECRRSLVRCGSTGETCVIDAAGRIVARLPLDEEGLLVTDVPLLEGTTPAVRWPWAFPWACGLGLAGIAAAGKLRSLGGRGA